MADLARIKRNVAKMASMNAPEADIDGYIASEGVTVDDVRNYGKDYTLGRLGTIDRGITFGLGRKLGGIINAIGSYPVDRVAEAMGVQNTPSFMDRYHEIVDPTMKAIEQYHEDKPVEAFALELGAGFANPANKLGVNYIKNAKNLTGAAVRSGIVGTGVGGVAGALNTENADNLAVNTLGGAGAGGIIGTAMPVAANRSGALYNGLKRIVAPEASVAGKATGLGNIVKDNESVRALNRGIMADDAVAAQVLQEAPTEMGRLNEELTDILNKTTGRKLNIEGAKQNADEAYRSYVAANADYPVYTTEEVKIPTEAQLNAYQAESQYNPNNKYTRADALTALEKRANNMGVELHNNIDEVKKAQLKLINKSNPMYDDYHTGIRKIDDIKTWEEAIDNPENFTWGDFTREQAQEALKNGKITIYSSKPIKNGGFVSTSKNQARDYAGGGKVYEQEVPLQDVAWINGDEGQYAPVKKGLGHFLKNDDRLPYARTLENTVNKPDVKLNHEGFDIYLKKYGNTQEKPFDYVVYDETGNPYTKYMVTGGYLSDKINAADNVSISGRVLGSTYGGHIAPYPNLMYNITQNGANVKRNVPNIKDIVGQLNEYKQNAMNKALAEGAAMSDYPVGSLDAVHKAQGVLNDMIEASYDKSVLGVKRPTTETSQLNDLKQVFNNMLEPSGVKPLDARISKAKSLDYFRDMGYKFKPSEKKFEDLGIKTLRDKRAFLQGRLQAILDNVKDDKNLAKAIRADENTLKKLMPAKKFNELLSETSRIDREYTRLNKFAQLASRELDKPIAADRPMSERSESLTSYLGSLYDKANARLWQNSNRRRAQALLNGGAVNPEWVQTLENYGAQYSPRYLTPYLAQIIAQNQ